MHKKPSFTLIELLVVISIIGVIASLLLAVLGKSREAARQSVCLSQQKQIGQLALMYSDDNDDYFLPRGDTNSTSGFWKNEIQSILSMKHSYGGIFKCPSNNLAYASPARNDGMVYSVEMGALNDPVKVNSADKPVETIMAGDSTDTGNWSVDTKLWKPTKIGKDPTIGNRHKNGINVLWADGHVSWQTRAYIMAGRDGNPDYYFDLVK